MRYKLVIFWTVWGDLSIGLLSRLQTKDYNNYLFEFNEDNNVDIILREPGNILYDVVIRDQELTFIKIPDTNIYKVDEQRNDPLLPEDYMQHFIRVIEEKDPLFNVDILLTGMGISKLNHTSVSKADVFSRILQAYLN
jgi:hypothetical protein